MRRKDMPDRAAVPPVVEMFETILAALPPGSAKLETQQQPDGEVSVRLIPNNPAAAPIAARGGGQLRYELVLGQGTIYEILPGRRFPVETLRAVCSAVIAGDFEETVYMVGKTVAKAVGKLKVHGKTQQTRAWLGFYPFVPKKKRVIQYAPY